MDRNTVILKKKKIWKKALFTGVIFIAVFTAAGLVFIHAELSKINKYVPEAIVAPQDETFETEETAQTTDQTPTASAEVVAPETVKWPSEAEQFSSPETVNIMLIGQDRLPGQGRQRSDSMIILSYSKSDKKIKLISLMRDMYLRIPGYSDNRINAAYQFGGMALLDKTVAKNFGVAINGNVAVDFDGFCRIVDHLGGIDIEVASYDADHLNKKFGWTLQPGPNHLNGAQALEYSRIRYAGNADYERTERQRNVMNLMINKIASLDLKNQLTTLDALLPYLTTDMTKQQILGFCYTVVQHGIDGVEKYRIPADGAYSAASIRGMSVLVPNIKKNQKLLRDYIG